MRRIMLAAALLLCLSTGQAQSDIDGIPWGLHPWGVEAQTLSGLSLTRMNGVDVLDATVQQRVFWPAHGDEGLELRIHYSSLRSDYARKECGVTGGVGLGAFLTRDVAADWTLRLRAGATRGGFIITPCIYAEKQWRGYASARLQYRWLENTAIVGHGGIVYDAETGRVIPRLLVGLQFGGVFRFSLDLGEMWMQDADYIRSTIGI
ncbi:MAG: hypothetical protein JXA28_13360 [Bacteroidetes bacterium]|nr:hypothetical protein [Bacteroidota bacterium]